MFNIAVYMLLLCEIKPVNFVMYYVFFLLQILCYLIVLPCSTDKISCI